MGVAEQVINMIKQLYKNPKYKVEMEGYTSEWHKQHTGIRQGCPLSPYLFLVIMTVMFHDIHQDEHQRENLEKDKILGTIFDEVLYADDTIIYSRNPETLQTLLRKMRKEDEKCGMELNKGKCELMEIRGKGTVKFVNGTEVQQKTESKYLGCRINEKGDVSKEVNQRISECFLTWKKSRNFGSTQTAR